LTKRIIFSSLLIISIFFIGSSFLEESERYVLILGDEHASPNDVYLEFYEVESVKNRQVIVDEGFVLFDDKEYWITDDWKGSFLNDDNLFFMAGKAENSDETWSGPLFLVPLFAYFYIILLSFMFALP